LWTESSVHFWAKNPFYDIRLLEVNAVGTKEKAKFFHARSLTSIYWVVLLKILEEIFFQLHDHFGLKCQWPVIPERI